MIGYITQNHALIHAFQPRVTGRTRCLDSVSQRIF